MTLGRALTRWALPALLAWQTAAGAAEPPADPIPIIDSGTHTAGIRRVGGDDQGRYLVTASEDKTVRLWDLAKGRLIKTLRVPIGQGEEGKLRAVAMSPDGKRIAAAGRTGQSWDTSRSIYVFDRDSGRMLKRLTGLPEVINDLAWSPDGRHLAATLFGTGGVRVYRMSDYTLVGSDTDYGDASHGADFDRSGRLVTSSYDGKLRLYQVEPKGLRLLAKAEPKPGLLPYGVAFSPNGKLVAVGYSDTPYAVVLAADDLAVSFEPDLEEIDRGDLNAVAWSVNGRTLYAAGGYQHNDIMRVISWDNGGRGRPVELPTAEGGVMDLLAVPQGLVFGAGESAWGLLDTLGKRRHFVPASLADYRGDPTDLGLSADGSAVGFSYVSWDRAPATFNVATRKLTLKTEGDLYIPQVETPELEVAGWYHTQRPSLNGKPLKIADHEASRSLAIHPDGKSFVLGGDWYLHRFGSDGRKLWQRPASAVAWAVNISDDGRLLVATHGDGTIRWYRVSDGQELLAFYPHGGRKLWVLWTPSGYYDASPGGEALLGWHLNRGKEQAAEFIPAERMRKRFHRPDVIDRVLETLDEAKAVELADRKAGRK